ncbi:hypothetical protein ACFQH6_18725 [Halobacteriaceae archaeon GCM10025711]
MLSGFAGSLGSTLNAGKEFLEDPLGFIESIRGIVKLASQLGILDDMVNALVDDFEQRQQDNNPYDPDQQPHLYDQFRTGWYEGYAAGIIAETVVGASAGKAVKGTKTYRKIADTLSDTRVGRTVARAKAPADRAKATVAYGIAKRGDVAASKVAGGAQTAGKTYRVWRLSKRLDSGVCTLTISTAGCSDDFLDKLTPQEKAALVGYLSEPMMTRPL